MTLGGEGTVYYDYEEIIELWKKESSTITAFSEKYNISVKTIRKILDKYGLRNTTEDEPKEVFILDKNTLEVIKECKSVYEASNVDSKEFRRDSVREVLTGRRKSHKGYYFVFKSMWNKEYAKKKFEEFTESNLSLAKFSKENKVPQAILLKMSA